MPKKNGFTLIEIVIVFLIIGLLCALAIPKFDHYRLRAVRSEALSNLGSIMRTEQAYFSDNATYTDNMAALGWLPDGAPKYMFGFTTDAVPAASGVNDTAELAAAVGGFRTQNMMDAFGNPLSQSDLPAAAVTETTAVVGAVANLDRDANLDQWTLNNEGDLTIVSDDVSE